MLSRGECVTEIGFVDIFAVDGLSFSGFPFCFAKIFRVAVLPVLEGRANLEDCNGSKDLSLSLPERNEERKEAEAADVLATIDCVALVGIEKHLKRINF